MARKPTDYAAPSDKGRGDPNRPSRTDRPSRYDRPSHENRPSRSDGHGKDKGSRR